jgi:hypothetical protein|tara:strand:- start:312 stop:728 length:417 start_codon:yes stop_codon:yes gene_type:complete
MIKHNYIHPSFELVNEFKDPNNPNKLSTNRWPRGFKRRVKAVYLLVLKGKVIKVGQSINFFRRMDDYKYRIGVACYHLTPDLNKLIRHTKENIQIYVRFYDEEKIRVDEWGEEVLQTDCVFAAEKKWKEIYKKTLKFD